MSITPIFLLSLPRSGSTFVQRVIAAHDGVATASEPHLLLPLLGPLATAAPMADAWQRKVAAATVDFARELPGGEEELLEEVRRLALRVYARAGGPNARWFLDKTPDYHLVADVILRAFPDARFVVLWRNPLSVVSSHVDTFGGGRWCVSRYRLQLFHGVDSLIAAQRRDPGRVHSVRYEDLLVGTDAWEALMDHLGLPFDSAALGGFGGAGLADRWRDPRLRVAYDAISMEPLEKYRRTLASPVRQAWCRRYLRWLGRERLAMMGYDLDELLASLRAVPVATDTVPADLLELARAMSHEMLRARMPGNGLVSSIRRLGGLS